MSTLKPTVEPTQEQLSNLYPAGLSLVLVQIVFRHGERTPLQPAFPEAGLPAFWPYCRTAERMVANIANNSDPSKWENFSYRRVIETFDPNDKPVIATSPDGNAFHVWYVVFRDHARKMFTSPSNPGELTDKGRQTTFELGRRLRRLYVDRLGFLPSVIDDPQIIYLRSTSAPRALESLIHTFDGLYSASQREKDVAKPTIVMRRAEDETMLPNVSDCQRMADLVREFGNRAARKWDNHVDMEYINKVYGRWLPPGSDRISLHSNPSLLTILDTVNSTLAHGSQTRLPSEFYDAKAIRVMDRIVRDEYFGGYAENAEYRMLGVGSFMGDMLHSMLDSIPACPSSFSGTLSAVGSETKCRKRFALLSCHDSTLVAILMSLGAFKGSIETWPPFSSHIAVELLKDDQSRPSPTTEDDYQLDAYYVRLRYNDEPVVIPGCEGLGNHLPGHEDFCTLKKFKAIVEKIAPKDWRKSCNSNLDKLPLPHAQKNPGV